MSQVRCAGREFSERSIYDRRGGEKTGCLAKGCATFFVGFALLSLLGGIVGEDGNKTMAEKKTMRVEAKQFGKKWPFTVPAGDIQCRGYQQAVFETMDGRLYGLNGLADSSGLYRNLKEIWRDDPENPELHLKINLGGFIDKALSLCN
jgi:hypothetical protein